MASSDTMISPTVKAPHRHGTGLKLGIPRLQTGAACHIRSTKLSTKADRTGLRLYGMDLTIKSPRLRVPLPVKCQLPAAEFFGDCLRRAS
jgi:hypothetical protein